MIYARYVIFIYCLAFFSLPVAASDEVDGFDNLEPFPIERIAPVNYRQTVMNIVHKKISESEYNVSKDLKETMHLHMFLERSGKLKYITVGKSSGSTDLDDAVIAAINASDPLPAIPESFLPQQETLQFTYSMSPK